MIQIGTLGLGGCAARTVGPLCIFLVAACAASGDTTQNVGGPATREVDGGASATDGRADPDAGAGRATRVVLFGGDGDTGDTWEWDGASWRQAASAGPAARSSHTLATLGTKVFLSGGFGQPNLQSTWAWDGKDWSELATSSPTARYEASSASLAKSVILFGGRTPREVDDTWEFDGLGWKQLAVAGPPARASHAMAGLGDRAVLFGGEYTSSAGFRELGDTWEWNGAAWVEKKIPGPGVRYGHAMATLGNKAILFGGCVGRVDTIYYQDTWEYEGGSWTRRSMQGPPGRCGHAMAVLDGKVILFGGLGYAGQRDSFGQRIIVRYDDTWEWNGTAWSQVTGVGPSGRARHQMAAR